MARKKAAAGAEWAKKAGKKGLVVYVDPEVKKAIELAAGRYGKPLRAVRTWIAAVIEMAAREQLGGLEDGQDGWTEEERRRWAEAVSALRKWPGEGE